MLCRRLPSLFLAAALAALPPLAVAQNAGESKTEKAKLDTSRGDKMIADYFRRETQKLSDACLADIQTADDWHAKKDEYRRQLHEMLGLDPLPEKTDLAATVTGKLDHPEFTVEKLHFQSRPGLYVTGNLYVPKEREGKLPAILYVCGHGNVKKDGISYGAKSHYQHHGAWFARNGYVCLVIDTLQLGEIEGIHHGTYRYNMWWWLNRGYTPAGVEAWNCVRALDYLQSRPEVDGEKLGVTGRSGGGAYSWWIAAIDERIKCTVPVAGITDLQNHVVDGCVEGHCDCMYMVNTYRWDYPQVAALVAPRPLLISNTDSDGIFPLDGVVRVFDKARRIYTLLGKRDQIGLNITSGGHKDTQELQVTAMRWFNHHLKGYDGPVTNHAEKFFEPEQLKVFDKLPEDQINTKVHETFVAEAPPPKVPESKEEWVTMREGWQKNLSEKSFRGTSYMALHSADPGPFGPRCASEVCTSEVNGIRLSVWECGDEDVMPARLYLLHRSALEKAELKIVHVLDEAAWQNFAGAIHAGFGPHAIKVELPTAKPEAWIETKAIVEKNPWLLVCIAPRGIGATAWDQSEKKQIQNRRRFYLLGQTLEDQQVRDVGAVLGCVTTIRAAADAPLRLRSERVMAGVTLYAVQSPSDIKFDRLDLYELPKRHRDGPTFLNLGRYLDMPQAVAMVAERAKVVIHQDDDSGWDYPRQVAKNLGWGVGQVEIRSHAEAAP